MIAAGNPVGFALAAHGNRNVARPGRRRDLDSVLGEQLAHLLNESVFVGELAGLQFGIDLISVRGQFETAAVGRFQLQLRDLALELR